MLQLGVSSRREGGAKEGNLGFIGRSATPCRPPVCQSFRFWSALRYLSSARSAWACSSRQARFPLDKTFIPRGHALSALLGPFLGLRITVASSLWDAALPFSFFIPVKRGNPLNEARRGIKQRSREDE
jgi:hypothetical protein